MCGLPPPAPRTSNGSAFIENLAQVVNIHHAEHVYMDRGQTGGVRRFHRATHRRFMGYDLIHDT